MTTVVVTLRDEDERFLEEAVKFGSFITKSEVIATALELLRKRGEIRTSRRDELKKEIQKGVDQLERGETVEFNVESFLAEMHTKHAAQTA